MENKKKARFGFVKVGVRALLASALASGGPSFQDAYAKQNCVSESRPAVCADEFVKAQVERACTLIESKGWRAIPEIDEIRYDCCGEPNYLWVHDESPRMVLHPIKTGLNGKSLESQTDPAGKKIFLEFARSAAVHPEGAWVDYVWKRFGQSVAAPKKSWIKRCKVATTGQFWVVGSGTWK